jgi:predicted acyl esterase
MNTIVMERDFAVPMRDGVRLFANLFKPTRPRPWHSHTRTQKVHPGCIVPVEIEIWPSATLFEAGSNLQLTVQGHDAARYPAFRHRKLVNRGWHAIFTGGPYDSCLAVPMNKSETTEILLASKHAFHDPIER